MYEYYNGLQAFKGINHANLANSEIQIGFFPKPGGILKDLPPAFILCKRKLPISLNALACI
ncbi:MAG TPA: hypothetical protein DEP36_06845 [Gammaproteobacteria bacterium]|nr:hypothetical protein [Gammaproteobacteria bacterium]